MKDDIYLSVIAASRNDGHGGNIFKRMELFVKGLITQSNRHQLFIELIIVEWNPPAGSPPLRDVLPKPSAVDKLILRYIIVPAELHNRYHRGTEIPLFQMIAKNVGIRRACGRFILCTNVDLIFSDPLFEFLALRQLKSDTYYRANRCDVPDEIQTSWTFERQLQWCTQNIIRRLGRDARFKNISLEQFGLNNHNWFKKTVFNFLALRMKFFWPPEKQQYYLLDSFACGDFTLMSREAWIDIQGYPELDLYSIHIDTLGLIAATASGYRQHVLPLDCCTFHIDHRSGWESMGPLEKIKFLQQRPGIDYSLVFETGMYALKNRGKLNINPPDWGFLNHDFEEHSFPANH